MRPVERKPVSGAVGATPLRPDGADKVTGRALFVDDLQPGALGLAELWHGATVRSPHAAARVVEIDASPALADPDVRVVTAADLTGPNHVALIADDWPVLAALHVRHVGEAVALVAGPTRERARAAAGRVRVRYEEEPALTDLATALEAEALALTGVTGGDAGGVAAGREDVRVLARRDLEHGDLAAGFAAADHVLEETYTTGHQEHVYIEPQGMIAQVHGDGAVDVIGSLQCPFYVHKALVKLCGTDHVRVRQAVTGGGFGGKEDYPSLLAAHAVVLARAAGRPVKIVYDRHEDLVATTKRHPAWMRLRTGFKATGELTALDIEVVLDGGAYVTLSPVVLSRAVIHAGGAYRCPHVRIRGRVLATNTVPNGAFRGFGAPQVHFAIERQMDRIARYLGLDPLTLRERNAYRAGDVTPTGQVLDASVSALECLRVAEERSDFRARWNACEAERSQRLTREDDGRPRRGIGLALAWHGTGFTGNGERVMRAPVRLRASSRGKVEVLVSSTDFGQGTTIVLAQIVADAVGVGLEHVEVALPDTDRVPDSGPTVASRTVMVVGGVLERAGRVLGARLCERLAAERGLGELRLWGGEFADAQGCVVARFEDALRLLLAAGPLVVEEHYEPEPGSVWNDETYQGDAYATYGWGVDVVEVSVDADTLAVVPERATLVCDVGKAIHPTLCAGQVEGGTLQALGWATLEAIRLDRGRYLNDTLSTYVIPTTLDTPAMTTILLENPAPVGPHGAKGVGEIPMDGGAPACVQAIENALGVSPTSIPATPEVLLADLFAGKTVTGDRA